MKTTFENALAGAERQMRRLLERYPADYYPMYTVGGKFGLDTKRWTHWCDGFYPGILFILAEETGSSYFLDEAVKRSTPLEPRQYDRAVHDLGFLFFSTYSRWKNLGGPAERIDPVLVQAGKTMAMRFQEDGQYLRSFVEPASCFIDIMMNVGTIFHAGRAASDGHLLAIAHRHCETTRRTLVRGDGSTAHEALFDTDTGACLRQSTHQGFRGDSCWSRGLAWSLYGFTRSFVQEGTPEYLATARAHADYLLAHTVGFVTPWDFDAPFEGPLARTRVDTSAAAIAASGLLDLADQLGYRRLESDRVAAERYRGWALNALGVLCRDFLGEGDDGFEGILRDGVYHIHKGLGVGEAVAFGDYFFVEALQKALRYVRLQPARVPQTDAYPEDSLPASARTWQDGPTEEDLPPPQEVG